MCLNFLIGNFIPSRNITAVCRGLFASVFLFCSCLFVFFYLLLLFFANCFETDAQAALFFNIVNIEIITNEHILFSNTVPLYDNNM